MQIGPGQLRSHAAKALQHYALSEGKVRLIRHNENAALEVTEPESTRRYLLRIHHPVSANLLGIQHTFEGLVSEIAILQAFREGTGLALQRPVSNNAGGLVTTVNAPELGMSPL